MTDETIHKDYRIVFQKRGQTFATEMLRARVFTPTGDFFYETSWLGSKCSVEKLVIQEISAHIADSKDETIRQQAARIERAAAFLDLKITGIEDGAILAEGWSIVKVHGLLCDIRDILEGDE